MFCLATNEIAQTGLSSLPPVIYYSEQLFSFPNPKCRLHLGLADRQAKGVQFVHRTHINHHHCELFYLV
ncbi:hypothetical protein E4184_08975 [Aeromonas media]|uniref:Uncharacterized protein n=1 Tax=Aeromonas media TaxID=651 RepID=A0A6M4Y935_AERME|nr:hypothetical protein E4184_08975 [Aeromonas media]